MSTLPASAPSGWQRFAGATVRAFHGYGNWLVGISWKRFFVLAVLLLIATGILETLLPSFRWTTTEIVDGPVPPVSPVPPVAREPAPAPSPSASRADPDGVTISIDRSGVRITPHAKPGASAPALPEVRIDLPPGATSTEVAEAVAEARREVTDALRDLAADRREAAESGAVADAPPGGVRLRTHRFNLGDVLMNLAAFFIASSAILKITYKGRVQAEVKAARAEETAEAESLKRQVVEARMAAMQAQVEPHFLFNTLASIHHLIETDPKRASLMQKNLIALLRAAMPTMREANGEAGGVRDLGRELAVIRPYLEILKVRMEERLATEVRVPEGLESAEFPPMMLQSLVENAIRHGLEPKPDGGSLRVSAEIVHGKLAVTVADTGLGFGKAATAGTGIGLTNIRERLALLYGGKATLTVTENQPSGSVVTITLPYAVRSAEGAST